MPGTLSSLSPFPSSATQSAVLPMTTPTEGSHDARRSWSFFTTLFAGLLVAGCADDDAESSACEYIACSIEEADCIERVAEAVGCHLEQDTVYPKVRLLTAEQYLTEVEDSTPPLTTMQARDRDDYLRMEALLGLMPEGYSPA